MKYADLPTSLKRAAGEPARVFGARDFRDGTYPMPYFNHDGRWVGPFGWMWMVRWADAPGFRCTDSTLSRARDRYGLTADTRSNLHDVVHDYLYGANVALAKFTELGTMPYCEQVIPTATLVVEGSASAIVPATPVAYALRRWGDEGQWAVLRTTGGKRVVRFTVDGVPCAAIAAFRDDE